MKKYIKFLQTKEDAFNILEKFVPIVERVHGPDHPEFYDVRLNFDKLLLKVNQKEYDTLNEEFTSLRKITSNYTIPNDVCESYETVYKLLEKLDYAYNN